MLASGTDILLLEKEWLCEPRTRDRYIGNEDSYKSNGGIWNQDASSIVSHLNERTAIIDFTFTC